jgi:hypothetical protein
MPTPPATLSAPETVLDAAVVFVIVVRPLNTAKIYKCHLYDNPEGAVV